MSAIDVALLVFVAIAIVYGLIRGVISQLMGVLGIIVALIWADDLGVLFSPLLKTLLGLSKFLADKFATFLSGLAIYLIFKIAGFFIHRAIGKNKDLKSINRLGGAVLGGVKGVLLIIVFFLFLTLVPESWVKSWLPKLPQSFTYRMAAKYNPMFDAQSLEKMRKFRSVFSEPKKMAKVKQSPAVKKVLEKHKVPGMLEDKRFIKVVEDGDYDALHKNQEFEKILKEDELTSLLEKIEKENP